MDRWTGVIIDCQDQSDSVVWINYLMEIRITWIDWWPPAEHRPVLCGVRRLYRHQHRKITILNNFRDFDFFSFLCKTRIFRSTSEALIWRFFMYDIFFSIIQELYVLRIKYPIWSVFGVSWTSTGIRSKQAISSYFEIFPIQNWNLWCYFRGIFRPDGVVECKKNYHQSIRNRFLHRI